MYTVWTEWELFFIIIIIIIIQKKSRMFGGLLFTRMSIFAITTIYTNILLFNHLISI